MTAPQPDQQQQDDHTAEEAAVIAALVLYFGSVAAVSATLLPARLATRLADLGLEPRAVRAAGRLAMAPPLTGRGRYGSPRHGGMTTTAARDVKADEPVMRARYVLASAKRLTRAIVLDARAATNPASDAAGETKESLFVKAVRVEKTYLDAHRAAGRNRAKAAAALDRAAAEAGPDGKLQWRTHPERGDVTPDCEELNGQLFTLDSPLMTQTEHGLVVARPGMMHPRCNCTASPVGGQFRAVETVTAS